MSDIKAIKLVTGEELISRVVPADNALGIKFSGDVVLDQPLVVHIVQQKDGMAVNFFPWTVLNDGNITVKAQSIVSVFDVPEDVEKSYLQNVSGIQIVSGLPTQLNG